jgi:thiosulfate/3-mercaptopyruvate sulfurtransferase
LTGDATRFMIFLPGIDNSMNFTTLISVEDLSAHANEDNWAVVDCRFSLSQPEKGRQDYLAAHISGAVYAHLDHDLSGPKMLGKTGRHPLPEMRTFADTLSSWGVDPRTQVVVYDDSSGSMAARLWWMLKWVGHEPVALLDGGWQSWRESGLPIKSGQETRPAKRFEPNEVAELLISTGQVQDLMRNPHVLILDARAAERYRGEIEPIDPVAGHIPGAVSSPFQENLSADGRFLAPEILRIRYEKLMKPVFLSNVICYCGSGVTAAHNLLAIAHAGLGMGKLYAGSWSEWVTDPARPIARG